MASISKRTWKTSKGEHRSAWLLHFVDRNGKQHREQFKLKRDAEERRVFIEGVLSAGQFISANNSKSVLDAAHLFLADYQALVDSVKRERSTLRGYAQHVNLHLAPYPLSGKLLSEFTGPDCSDFARYLESSLSDAMARRVFGTFRRVIDFGVSQGWIAANVAKSIKIRTSGARSIDSKIKFPSKKQLRALVDASVEFDEKHKCHGMICILMFCGLRISELRGLRWQDVDLENGRMKVRQRADRWQQIGAVKTSNAKRGIPMPLTTISALKKWRIASPITKLDLVFPSGSGNPENYANIYNRIWRPLMEGSGLMKVEKCEFGEKSRPIFSPHMLRHVACSLWIEQGAKADRVKKWAGHANIHFTFDRYGHLWEDHASDQDIASRVEKSLGL